MADPRRFELFADLIVARFAAPRIFDVAGGAGRLNAELTARGRTVTTFDRKPKRLDVRYAERRFTLDEPCECDLVVGMHPDGATRVIVEYARRWRVPFAVVPCCSDDGTSYGVWMKTLRRLADSGGFASVGEVDLGMRGRARAIVGEW
ncbi:MAG TPA: hypothetical protein VHF22_03665 [Planctomycetota bacterium]|nr:hypothetical protein [Planctomycetota bacterium]